MYHQLIFCFWTFGFLQPWETKMISYLFISFLAYLYYFYKSIIVSITLLFLFYSLCYCHACLMDHILLLILVACWNKGFKYLDLFFLKCHEMHHLNYGLEWSMTQIYPIHAIWHYLEQNPGTRESSFGPSVSMDFVPQPEDHLKFNGTFFQIQGMSESWKLSWKQNIFKAAYSLIDFINRVIQG